MVTELDLREVVQWDVDTWSAALPFWESRVPIEGRCLELGARKGGLSLWLALKGCDVVCSDLWGTRKRALPLHVRHGVMVEYEDIDATAIPYEDAFDLVVFKSVLGDLRTLERQRRALAGMHRALKPGGALLFAENLRATPVHRLIRRAKRYQWRHVSLGELRECLRPFADVEIRTAGFTSLPWLDWLPIPAGWHYVAYGVARKSSQ